MVLPSRYSVVRDQLVIHSDFKIATHHRLLEELVARRTDLTETLGLPVSDEPIHVYLFENAEEFRQFVSLQHPHFPARRAFFLETDDRLQVYAQWGDRVAEDLRHEVTHGYLHSVVPSIPLWLDEGLAEYSEPPRGSRGVVSSHLELLRKKHESGWRPDLQRLEAILPTQDMTQEDYAEAWAWVHYLLESGPEQRIVLQRYLMDLRRDPRNAVALSARLQQLVGATDAVLLAHLDDVTHGRMRPEMIARRPSVDETRYDEPYYDDGQYAPPPRTPFSRDARGL